MKHNDLNNTTPKKVENKLKHSIFWGHTLKWRFTINLYR